MTKTINETKHRICEIIQYVLDCCIEMNANVCFKEYERMIQCVPYDGHDNDKDKQDTLQDDVLENWIDRFGGSGRVP